VLRLSQWMSRAHSLQSEIQQTTIPWRSNPRMQRQHRQGDQVRSLSAMLPAAEFGEVTAAYGNFRASAAGNARRVLDAGTDRIRERASHLVLPPGLGGLDDQRLATALPVPGVGPLIMRVGSVSPSPLRITLYNPANLNSPETVEVVTTGATVPWLMNLDTCGGLVTDSVTTVNSVLLRLLALLPAGQVRAHVYDPVRLGESVKFLFGLGDAAAAVIGEKVKTTDRELGELLVELEEHLTFVTQKYLGEQYETLSAYNADAGDVAEPYRVLVLYDYPQGFGQAGGGAPSELANRLGKIVKSGPRCGVFTLVVAPAVSPGQQDDSVLTAAIQGLPKLYPGHAPSPQFAALPAAVMNPKDAPTATDGPTSGRGTVDRKAQGEQVRSFLDLMKDAPTATDGPTSGRGAVDRKAQGQRVFYAGHYRSWGWQPEPTADPGVVSALIAHLERGLVHAEDVRVDAAGVSRLAAARLAHDVARGVRQPEVLPDPADPSTWWQGNSAREVFATFARVGANGVGELHFDSESSSHALLGGQPGSGKSVLLHAVITDLVRRYSPADLELYLVDHKQGVEFKTYAAGRLPHARVIAVDAEREFGLSVLHSLDAELAHRGQLFRSSGGEQVNLAAYREQTGKPLPRIVAILDEFHMLFEVDDAIAATAGELIDRIVRLGRAFGVHLLLASQTLAGTAGLGRHTLSLVRVRLALTSSDVDSRLLLGDDNPDAKLLTRAGEGILNTEGGLKDANQRFQAVYTTAEEREQLTGYLRVRADAAGFTRGPVVFEGHNLADVDEQVDTVLAEISPSAPAVPLGLPLSLDPPVVAPLRREPGGNLLVVANDELAYPLLTVALTGLAGAGVGTTVLDYGPVDAPWTPALDVLTAATGSVRVLRRRQASDALAEFAALVESRHALSEHRSSAQVLVIVAAHRARELDAGGYGGDENEHLEKILFDGADVGVHVVAWLDKPIKVERKLSSRALRELGLRAIAQASREDSYRLIDSEGAASLHPEQLLFDDHDRATTVRLRGFAAPPPEWVAARMRR
jgi:hypothetical protein